MSIAFRKLLYLIPPRDAEDKRARFVEPARVLRAAMNAQLDPGLRFVVVIPDNYGFPILQEELDRDDIANELVKWFPDLDKQIRVWQQ